MRKLKSLISRVQPLYYFSRKCYKALVSTCNFASYSYSRIFIARRALDSSSGLAGRPCSILPRTTSFFGYYHLSPENNKKEVIFCQPTGNKNTRRTDRPLKICIRHINGECAVIGHTKAWNWQQGCMLQWLPPDYSKIIYNDYDESVNKYISRVVDRTGTENRIFDMPVASISKCGTYALTLNYDRLSIINPSYGYPCKRNPVLPLDTQDGIWRINLKDGASSLIVTIEELKRIKPKKNMRHAIHKVNHIDISPSGEKFIFLHRWRGPKGRFHRLIVANSTTKDIRILKEDTMISHCCWLDDSKVISFCKGSESGQAYYVFETADGRNSPLSDKLPKEDGHPSISPDNRWLLTDTYPNALNGRMAQLYLYDMQADKLVDVGKFHQPFRYQRDYRIDLHPKWSLDGATIFFESGHSGRRQLYQLNVEKLKSSALRWNQ